MAKPAPSYGLLAVFTGATVSEAPGTVVEEEQELENWPPASIVIVMAF